ncbi:MAG TPA: iron-sulfur cluster biosynthesis family protein [Dehalococcoidia bacterium]|jgi:iron-sulfur cluster assembly accessory protein
MINVTREALERFRSMQAAQDDANLVLKLYAQPVEGQVRYGMSWSEAEESDVVLESDGVCLHVDELSVPFWAGAEVGYVSEDLRQGFTIRGPGMGGGCGGGGCGGGCSCGARG